MKFLSTLILKTQYELGELRRRAYICFKRFVQLENLWLVFLRAKEFKEYPAGKKERLTKIFVTLLGIHQNGTLTSDFLRETGLHFLSAK